MASFWENISVVCFWRFRDEDPILDECPGLCNIRKKVVGEKTATVPVAWVTPSSSFPRLRNVMSSSDVAFEKASARWGVKNAICEGEKTGDNFGSEINNSWRIPRSWIWEIPCKICLISDSERSWGCWGVILKSPEVWRVTFPFSLWWIGVLTSGVQVHWTANKKNVAMTPQVFRKT